MIHVKPHAGTRGETDAWGERLGELKKQRPERAIGNGYKARGS